jgi:hypothetical protein
MPELGRFLLAAGVLLVLAGLLLTYGSGLPGASWIGRLPGDISVERPGFRVYVPLTTCLLVSAVLTLVLYLLRR